MRSADALVITCEHAGHVVPARYRACFAGAAARTALASHRGWDPGALALARDIARAHGAPLFAHKVTRLLVEANRSPGHRRLFSEFSRGLPRAEKDRLLARTYAPHRERAERAMARHVMAGRCVLHVAVHTFTPVLDGIRRDADVAPHFDPHRRWETAICERWMEALRAAEPKLRVRRNYPYRGWGDGFTTYLRKRFPASRYAGVELEVNQRFPLGPAARWRRVRRTIVRSLAELVE